MCGEILTPKSTNAELIHNLIQFDSYVQKGNFTKFANDQKNLHAHLI